MSTGPVDHSARLKAALEAMRKQQARIDALERQLAGAREPIAVVGIGCRFPGGADDPAAFWSRLRSGFDAIREVPADRWPADALFDANPDAPGRISTRLGGFLESVDRFDARFFQISPREARSMDPQQRLLLEVAWEALEHGGIPARTLAGSLTGVFVGLTTLDYARVLYRDDLTQLDTYSATGNVANVAAGRLSYVFGLRGPAVTLDTACSSSLVSLHLACQSLRAGECDAALAGGVNLMLTPDNFVAVSRAHMLSPDGRCKAFDRSANGYGRSEGCGIVVLKRWSDARAAGNRVIGVILGSAVRQDGQRGGLTVPNGEAQRTVMTAALRSAGIAAHDVGYVEAHGTGTSLGDPIEFEALGGAYGGASRTQPLVVGSLKTNVGHMESAAGIGGIVKTLLAVSRGEIPPHLHFRDANPEIALDDIPATIPTRVTAWPAGYARRIAGVSSFGSSGTIAHVILAEPDRVDPPPATEPRGPRVLPLSAKTDGALDELIARYAERFAAAGDDEVADICFTAGAGREHFLRRTAVVASTAREFADKLRRRDFAFGGSDAAAAARDYVAGVDVDWRALQPGAIVDAPTYPFQRERHWVEEPATIPAVTAAEADRRARIEGGPRFGMMFFNGSETPGRDSYRLLIESARFADAHGFSSVWVPERHFTAFGSLYPNPATVHAALARETRRVRLMAGSLVLPLHNVLRAAEEWAVVDNLSGGRAGMSLASGWNPDDFALNPAAYAERREALARGVETMRRLWRGDTIAATSGTGKDIAVRTFPTPVQRELPLWLTAARSPETFAFAGAEGAHLLTHLLDHDVDQLAAKIVRYRDARAAAGHDPATGQVTVMLHTFVGRTLDEVHAKVRAPYTQYLKDNIHLLSGLAANRSSVADLTKLTGADLDAFVGFIYERFFSTRALLGTVETCLPLVEKLYAAGVNEIACLLDFGPATNDVLAHLPFLDELMLRARGGQAGLKACAPSGQPADVEAAAVSRAPVGAGTADTKTVVAQAFRPAKAAGPHPVSLPPDGSESPALYDVAWREIAVERASNLGPTGPWAVLDQRTDIGAAVAALLSSAGTRCASLDPRALDAAADADGIASSLAGDGVRDVICAWHLGVEDDDAAALERSLMRVARLVDALVRVNAPSAVRPRLWFLTRGARAHAPSQAALAAFVKVLPIEQLPLWGGAIDLDRASSASALAPRLLDVVLHTGREDQVAIDGGRVLAARLAPAAAAARPARDWSCRADAAYLVTGGFGGVGVEVARWLASHGATHIVLAGRTVQDAVVRSLAIDGVTIEAVALDVADRAGLTAWLDARRARGARPIAGIVHAAGVWHDRPIAQLDADALGRVLAPKVAGTLALDAVFPAGQLDLFIAFSAFSSFLPAEGQANYAAANAFMDAVVRRRRAAGEHALSINWGPWSDVGFATTDYGRRAHQRLTALGIARLTPARGRAWLDRLVAEDRDQVGVMPVDWATLFAADPNARLSPFLGEMAGAGEAVSAADAQAAGRLAAEIAPLDSRAQLARLESALTGIVSGVMRINPSEIDRAGDLGTLGLDSLMAVEIKNRLQHDTGVTVPLVQLLEGISIAALAEVLLTRLKVSGLSARPADQSLDSTGSLEEIEI